MWQSKIPSNACLVLEIDKYLSRELHFYVTAYVNLDQKEWLKQ